MDRVYNGSYYIILRNDDLENNTIYLSIVTTAEGELAARLALRLPSAPLSEKVIEGELSPLIEQLSRVVLLLENCITAVSEHDPMAGPLLKALSPLVGRDMGLNSLLMSMVEACSSALFEATIVECNPLYFPNIRKLFDGSVVYERR